MPYRRVCLEGLGYVLPAERVSSATLEARLEPLYDRLRLPVGRLELMTGIRERRFFPPGTLPSQVSVSSASLALQASGLDPREIGALVHGSVCRDHLEPATSCSVHHALGLGPECHLFDVSNACLGILTGVLQIANMIELGQIRAGIAVGAELGRNLVETTIERLNADAGLTRQGVKPYLASLTIGSASAAIVVCDAELSRTQTRLIDAATLAATQHHRLCQSEGLTDFMRTDSEALLHAGVRAAEENFARLLGQIGGSRERIDKTICHQVGAAHRRRLLEALGLDPRRDFSTFENLGNTGSAALPTALAQAAENGWLANGDRLALLGIGSGINCQMLAIDWQATPVRGAVFGGC
jgi:3-oxoacyl-[acyl-carrier-protein] synthase-3